MALYRKKPVVIEAIQYRGFYSDEIKVTCVDAERSTPREPLGWRRGGDGYWWQLLSCGCCTVKRAKAGGWW